MPLMIIHFVRSKCYNNTNETRTNAQTHFLDSITARVGATEPSSARRNADAKLAGFATIDDYSRLLAVDERAS